MCENVRNARAAGFSPRDAGIAVTSTTFVNSRRLKPAARMVVKLTLVALMTLACGCAGRTPRAEAVYFPTDSNSPRVVHLISFNSLHDVVNRRAGFVEFVRGGPVSPYVATPAGIAYRSGHLYICDTGTGALHDWDLSTGRAKRLGLSGETVLVKPVDVAIDDASVLYVADTGRGEVVAFDATGKATRRLRPPDREEYRPVAVAVHGSTLYVADIAAHRIDRF
ncbi:MAG: hypothetical protein IIB60_01745, partial [Planctomycetes bacterium]|nr:hypothetical protein [Planctomycetota bacterium]